MKAKSLSPRSTCRGILAAAQAIIALGLWTANLTAAAAAQKRATLNRNVETYYLLVFSNPIAGRDDEYNKWYDGRHLTDVTSVPGFVSGQRYVVSAAQLRDEAKPPENIWRSTKFLPMIWRLYSRRLIDASTQASQL